MTRPRFGYQAYGLEIASVLVLPEAKPSAACNIDVTMLLGEVPNEPLPMTPHRFRLYIPGVARFEVSDGNRILIDADPNADAASIRLFLLGSAFGALLFQRGLLVLHGNAVLVDKGCVICVGPSGAGKSTLAAAFLRRGHVVLADDVVAIDSQGCALPGFARIKLWGDAANKLAIDTSHLERIRPEADKFSVPTGALPNAPVPVRAVYLLTSGPDPTVSIEPIAGAAAFRLLRENTYREHYVKEMGLRPAHLALCGTLASRIRTARVIRPAAGFEIDPLIESILADTPTCS